MSAGDVGGEGKGEGDGRKGRGGREWTGGRRIGGMSQSVIVGGRESSVPP